ncbi:MAG: multicopper oxidase domain-containing protein [Bradyrhizobium sp.]
MAFARIRRRANTPDRLRTIAQWRSGHCVSPPTTFDIPFAELGEFVYHCHILEHEDGGMMARVKVVPAAF